MKLLISGDEEMTDIDFDRVKTALPDVDVVWSQSPEETAKVIPEADVLLGMPSRQEFLAAKKLKWIQYPGAGVEKLLKLKELVESDVIVTNARGIFIDALAEHTFATMLYFSRALGHFSQAQNGKRWEQSWGRGVVREIVGLTLGIIGYGDTGDAIAKRAAAFGMRVVGVSASKKEKPAYVDTLWTGDGLDELLKISDFVVLTVPLTSQTKGMMGAEQLGLMKPTAYLINISRGLIVDEGALIKTLEERRIAGAALDVFYDEPLPAESEFWEMDNVLVTPHVAGDSDNHRERLIAVLQKNVRRFREGEPLINLVDKHRGY